MPSLPASVSETVRHCTRASDDSSLTFPAVLGLLAQAGIERYACDLVRAEKTYYMPDGASEVVTSAAIGIAAPAIFAADGVNAAVRAVQQGRITYKQFCEQAMQAGCVGYHVSLAGRRVVYYGRTGDSHTEWFPGAP